MLPAGAARQLQVTPKWFRRAFFEETISFAIVLGLGPAWAKKFEGLLSSPPSWYTNSGSGYSGSSSGGSSFSSGGGGKANKQLREQYPELYVIGCQLILLE